MVKTKITFITIFTFILLSASTALSADFKVATWNLESGDAAPHYLSRQTIEHPTIDIWGLTEVQNKSVGKTMASVLNQYSRGHFKLIMGSTDGADKLAILVNMNKFDVVNAFERSGPDCSDSSAARLRWSIIKM